MYWLQQEGRENVQLPHVYVIKKVSRRWEAGITWCWFRVVYRCFEMTSYDHNVAKHSNITKVTFIQTTP